MGKTVNSAACIAMLAMGLPMEALPLDNRTDFWWDKFWYHFGLNEVRRIAESASE